MHFYGENKQVQLILALETPKQFLPFTLNVVVCKAVGKNVTGSQ